MKSKVVSVRITQDEYETLVREGKGAGKLCRVLRERLLGATKGQRCRRHYELLCALERVRANLAALAQHVDKCDTMEAVTMMSVLVAAEQHLETLTKGREEG